METFCYRLILSNAPTALSAFAVALGECVNETVLVRIGDTAVKPPRQNAFQSCVF